MSDSTNSLMSHLASQTRSSYAQNSILTFGSRYDLHRLAANPLLIPEVWKALASIKNDVVLTCHLTNHQQVLTEEQIRLLAKDKRIEPRRFLLRNALGQVGRELGEEILHSKHPLSEPEMAHTWLLSRKVPDQMLKVLVAADSSRFSLPYLGRADIFTVSEVAQLLAGFKDTRLAGPSLWKLIDHRPTLIPALTSSEDEYIVEALAGSRHLFDQAYFEKAFAFAKELELTKSSKSNSWAIFTTLLANPNVAPALKLEIRPRVYLTNSIVRVVANKVSSEGRFEGIIKTYDHQHNHKAVISYTTPWEDNMEEVKEFFRTTAYMGNFFNRNRYPALAPSLPGFPPETPAPAKDGLTNTSLPNLTPLDKMVLSEAGSPKSVISANQLFNEIEPALDAIGQGAWDQFFALSVAWHGSVADLLEMVTNLS